MKERYPLKIRGRQGPKERVETKIRIFNRIVTWDTTLTKDMPR